MDLLWWEDMTNSNRQDEFRKRRSSTKPDVHRFDAAASALQIDARPLLAFALLNLAVASLNLVRVVLYISRTVQDRAPPVRCLALVIMRLVLSAGRLYLFAEHQILSVVHHVPFAERLAPFLISHALQITQCVSTC